MTPKRSSISCQVWQQVVSDFEGLLQHVSNWSLVAHLMLRAGIGRDVERVQILQLHRGPLLAD